MNKNDKHAGNLVLIQGAALWLMVALVLAWCLVFMKLDLSFIKAIFKDFNRLLQGHIDFLLMSALMFGFYAAKIPFPWHVNWAIVVGACTNSSLFLLMSIFPSLSTPEEGFFKALFGLLTMASVIVTSYGFGRGAFIIYQSVSSQSGEYQP